MDPRASSLGDRIWELGVGPVPIPTGIRLLVAGGRRIAGKSDTMLGKFLKKWNGGKEASERCIHFWLSCFSCQIQHGHLYVCLCMHISKVELYIAPAQPARVPCCWAGCLGLLRQSTNTGWEGRNRIKFFIHGESQGRETERNKPPHGITFW